jgi:CheY-like chemotaxis protein/anti-sigma regulatory factor (Ser/Thr protein kinase)
MFRPQAQAKGLTFHHIRAKSLPQYVRNDEKRLRQILVNLLSNAIKFTDAGSVTFEVAYRSQVATFTVTDSGRGISPKDLARIYEPFQRGEADNIKPMPGLGLGLTITQLLTNTLGGEISATSEKDVGSTFRVRLMLSAIDRPSTAPAAEKKIVSYAGPRRTIMVVDDNEDHRDLMQEVLSPLDFVVLTAQSGPDCLTLIEGLRPDAFLIDISMPGMNGWQLVAKLRDAGQTAPIIMLSANIGDTAIIGAGTDGHNDAIAKPVDIRKLCDRLAVHLGLHWVYEKDLSTVIVSTAPPAPLKAPASVHLQDLLRLGEIGYIRGIEAKLDDLDRSQENLPFTAQARNFVRSFDLTGYAAFIKKFEDKRTGTDD